MINQDVVLGGGGFDEHGHADMEILSYVLDGELVHGDSMGHNRPLKAGDVQLMSAGRGVRHSEFNGSADAPLHFLQIWITPDKKGHEPRYQERFISTNDKRDHLALLVSPDGRDQSLMIHQDASVFATIMSPGQKIDYQFIDGRHGWVQLVHGNIQLNEGVFLAPGDGAAISDVQGLEIENAGDQDAEFLLFDLA